MSEFDIIKTYFSKYTKLQSDGKIFGVGDDCALFSSSYDKQIAISTDMLIEDRHFFHGTDPSSIGHKSLAVNLSDLSAMGANPIGCLLSIGIPAVDKKWLHSYAEGLYNISTKYSCPLIGGDTTRSNSKIIINITVFGELPYTESMKRHNAKIGDEIWVSGFLGEADIAYKMISNHINYDKEILDNTIIALERPNPRLNLGQNLLEIANAAIDISDGLIQDLKHILVASGVGADIFYSKIPVAKSIVSLSKNIIKKSILTGGDVYELCFTAPESKHDDIMKLSNKLNLNLSMIGIINNSSNLRIYDIQGQEIQYHSTGFDHFI